MSRPRERWSRQATGSSLFGRTLALPGELHGAHDRRIGTGGMSVPLSFAFQPIVDATAREIVSHEALIRGRRNEPASSVLATLTRTDLQRLDAEARGVAIALAASLGIQTWLNLNITPQGLTSEPAMAITLEAAARSGLSPDRLVMEVTETEVVADGERFAQAIHDLRHQGVHLAIDDFGAGYSGLNLLAEFQPDLLKLDMHLVRGIESKGARQAIVRAVLGVCRDLAIDVVAEGVETYDEYAWFRDQGVRLFQGYFFAKPAFEKLPDATYPG